jgi:hypothetical protein
VPDVLPLADRGVAVAEEATVTDPTVISPPNREIPETWTDAVAVVFALPAAPVTDEETEAALAIDPNAKPPLDDAFGGAEIPPAEAPPPPGTDTEMPKASALGVPTLVAEGAPAEPVSARTATRPTRSEYRRATASD